MNKIRLGNKDIYYQVFYKNNKYMYLRVKSNLIVVTCNKQVSKKKIESFILENERKILNQIESYNNKITLYSKTDFLLFGKNYELNFLTNHSRNCYHIDGDTITIGFKNDYFDTKYLEKIYTEALQEKIKSIYSIEKSDLDRYFNTDNVVFKTQLMKSRFGSCIAKKRIIKLNTILARFSPEFTRTILIHELIHLKEQNHKSGFYSYIDILIPNYKQQIKQLNQLSRKYVI